MGSKRTRVTSSQNELSALALSRQMEAFRASTQPGLRCGFSAGQAAEARRSERDQLANRARYLLNTVSAARAFAQAPPPPVAMPKSSKRSGKKTPRLARSKELATPDPLTAFHAQAEAELQKATAALASREVREEGALLLRMANCGPSCGDEPRPTCRSTVLGSRSGRIRWGPIRSSFRQKA